MKFLQVHTFYDQYLQNFYQRHAYLANESFSEQIQQLIKDGFGGGHIFPPYLRQAGYDAQLIIANNYVKQSRWLIENNVSLQNPQQWFFEIVRQQIEHFKPDVLYFGDPISFDRKFVDWLSWKPELVIGWRAAPVASTTDWSCFDILLSSASVCLDIARELGAKNCEYFYPGFPSFIANDVESQGIEWDVVFSGQWSALHSRRNAYLQAISKAPLLGRGDFSIGYFLAADPGNLPAGIAMHNQGPRWGIEMYRALRSGKICLNAAIDMVNLEAPNMRLFEAAGVGAFLLNEAQSRLNNFFEIGAEVETFSGESELIEKINYYLNHPRDREEIARRAQARCLTDYSMERRAAALHEIIQSHMTHPHVMSSQTVGQLQRSLTPEVKKLQQRIIQSPCASDAYYELSQVLKRFGHHGAAQRSQQRGWRVQWGDRDYVSPGLSLVNADAHFPNLTLGDRTLITWPYLRKEIPHNWYVDRRCPTVGFLSRDEAHLLYNLALAFQGKPALEIGCWMGWSACHLALAGVQLDVVDPLLGDPGVYQTVSDSLTSAGVRDHVNLVPGYSPQAVQALAAQRQQPWSLIFIDGNHERPGPLEDAMVCAQLAAPDAAIVFHDLASPDVAEGLDYLRQQGWNTMVYQTMQIMGVAWRGNVEPIQHQPDPQVNWTLPPHLQGYLISGMVNFPSQVTSSAPGIVDPQAAIPQIQALMQQSVNFYNNNQPVEALRAVEQAASLRIFIPELYYLRAVCLAKVGRCEEALAAAREELRLNPVHTQVRAFIDNLAQAITRPEASVIPTSQRPWNTSLNRETLMSIQNASHNYAYRGVPMIKNPFDFALYPMLLWNVKPRTIIEIGSKEGGSGLWLGDLIDNFDLDCHIYSLDIVRVDSVSHPRVTFMEANGRLLGETLSAEFINSLPRPLLIIEDADHAYETSIGVLEFFHPHLQLGEYIVIEDGIISDIVQDPSYNSGPHRALKEFLGRYPDHYEIDGNYCDFFGYNLTWCTNGFLKKVR
jgi:cephalosporin hydroxylase